MNFTGDVEMFDRAFGMSLPRGESPTPTTVMSASTSFSASYEAARNFANAIPDAPDPLRVNCGCQNRVRFGSFPTTNSSTCGYVRASTRSHCVNRPSAAGLPVIARAFPMCTPNERWIPFASACGIARSRNAFSLIASGCAGSQLTVILFDCRSAAASSLKNHAPPSSSYLPRSSETPKRGAPAAAPASASARHVATAVIVSRLMLSLRRFGARRGNLQGIFEYLVKEPFRSEADGIVGWKTGLGLGGGDRRTRAGVVELTGVERDAGDAPAPDRQREPLVEVDELRESGQRVTRVALDLGRSCQVAEQVEMRDAPVDQAERHPRVRRVYDRALPLDPEHIGPASAVALDDEPLGRARDEVGDDGVDGDPPTRDRDSGLAGRHELRRDAARAGGAVELERNGHLPDRTVGADREDDPRRHSKVCAGRDVEVAGRLAEVAQLDAMPRRQLRELGIVGDELVEAVLDVETLRDRRLEQLAPLRRKATALRRDADERGRRVEAQRVGDGGDYGDPVVRLARVRRVEDRDDRIGAVVEDAARRLSVVRVRRAALSEDQVPLL